MPNPDGSTPWWYPYGFLDPHTAVYGSAFTYIGGILFAFVLLGIAIIGIGRSRERHAVARDVTAWLQTGELPQLRVTRRRWRRRRSGSSRG